MSFRSLYIWLCAVIAITACGGGSVAISTTHPDKRPAHSVVKKIGDLQGSELTQYLNALHSSQGDDLDWAQFWDLMAAQPRREELLVDNRESFLSLHGRACEARYFNSFVRFVEKVGDGFEFVLSEKRLCLLPLNPLVAKQFVETVWVSTPLEKKPVIAPALLDFLTTEIAKSPTSAWLPWDRNFESYLSVIAVAAIRAGSGGSVARWMAQQRSMTGTIPFPELALTLLFDDAGNWQQQTADSFGQNELSKLVVGLLPRHRSPKWILERAAAEVLLDRLFTNPFDTRSDNWSIQWAQFGRLTEILESSSQVLPLAKRAAYMEELLKSFMSWTSNADYYSQFLNEREVLENVANDTMYMAAAFIVVDAAANSESERISVRMRENLLRINPEQLTDLGQIMHSLISLRLSATSEEQKLLAERYCAVARKQGLGGIRILPLDAITRKPLPLELESGCYQIDADNGDSLEFTSIQSTWFTLVIFPKANVLRLKAPQIDLANIALSFDTSSGSGAKLELVTNSNSKTYLFGHQLPSSYRKVIRVPFQAKETK